MLEKIGKQDLRAEATECAKFAARIFKLISCGIDYKIKRTALTLREQLKKGISIIRENNIIINMKNQHLFPE